MILDTRKRHPQLFEAGLIKKSNVSAIDLRFDGIWRVLWWGALYRKMPSLRSFASHLGETKVTEKIQIFDLKQ